MLKNSTCFFRFQLLLFSGCFSLCLIAGFVGSAVFLVYLGGKVRVKKADGHFGLAVCCSSWST